MRELSYRVADLSCQQCAAAVRRALSALPGVASVKVSVPEKLVTLEVAPELATSLLSQAIREAGYTPEPLEGPEPGAGP